MPFCTSYMVMSYYIHFQKAGSNTSREFIGTTFVVRVTCSWSRSRMLKYAMLYLFKRLILIQAENRPNISMSRSKVKNI